MKNYLLLFACLAFNYFLLSSSSQAQTYVSGFISANTNWTVAGSPYIVTGNALLSHGYTLTIDPGVVVKFDTNRTLQIDGELIAIGTPQNRITFTSRQASPKAGDWGKIHFSDTCVDAMFDANGTYLSGSIMKYCDVLYGGGLGFGEIHIVSSSPYLSHCNISNSSVEGILSNTASYLLDSSTVQYCNGFGLMFLSTSGKLIIQDDTIQYNNGGISLYACTNIVINRNFFYQNSTSACIHTFGVFNILILENYFLSNASPNEGTVFFTQGVKGGTISCNKFINNSASGQRTGMISTNSYPSDGVIRSNIFDSNVLSAGAAILYMYMSNGSDKVFFEDNIVKNNNSDNYICYFQPNLYYANTLNINSNSFSGNKFKNLIYLKGYQTSNISIYFSNIKFNNFLDTASATVINNQIPYGSPNVYANNNYWGSINTQHIDSVVYDYFDYGNLSVVYYQPPLIESAVIDTTCSFFTSVPSYSSKTPLSKVFPNPFSTVTKIEFGKNVRDASLRVYNIYGQEVKQAEHINGEYVLLNREGMTNGIYLFEAFERNERIAVGKLVVN